MVKKFFVWYKMKLKNKPVVIILFTIIFLITGIGSFSSGIKESINLIKYIDSKVFIDKYETEYEKIKKLDTGINIKYIDELFGIPTLRKLKDGDSNDTESFYICNGYLVHTTSDKNDVVNMYSITVSDEEFLAPIPLDSFKDLGKLKMSDLMCENAYGIVAEHEGGYGTYTEFYRFGDPGSYKYYAFGYSALGTNLDDDDLVYKICICGNESIHNNTDLENDVTFMKARDDFKPNSFSVIEESVFLSGELEEFHNIGLCYIEGKYLVKNN